MTIFNKQPCGTLGAFRWNNGITFGIYKKGNFASFEYNDETKELLLIICEEAAKKQGVVFKYVTEDEWNKL